MTDMMAEIAAFDGRTAKIVGPARSGKTEALLHAQGKMTRPLFIGILKLYNFKHFIDPPLRQI